MCKLFFYRGQVHSEKNQSTIPSSLQIRRRGTFFFFLMMVKKEKCRNSGFEIYYFLSYCLFTPIGLHLRHKRFIGYHVLHFAPEVVDEFLNFPSTRARWGQRERTEELFWSNVPAGLTPSDPWWLKKRRNFWKKDM